MDVEFTIVIPLYNEKESIKELFENIQKSLRKVKKSYEIMFIDDGSNDGSLDLLKSLEGGRNHVRVYSFRRNLGKSYALMLGFKNAAGKYIITMDADLQDDPRNIQYMYDKLKRNGLDMISGWRRSRKDFYFKNVSSGVFNKLISVIFKLDIHDLNSGLKIYKSKTVKDLKLYGGLHRFIPLLVREMGYKVGEKEVTHMPRKYGQSKYKMTKVLTDIPDLVTVYFLTKYNRRPLHFFGKIGSVIFIIGFIILGYLSLLRFLGEKIGERPLLLFGILLVITGIQIVFTGMLADLIVNLNTKEDGQYPLKYSTEQGEL